MRDRPRASRQDVADPVQDAVHECPGDGPIVRTLAKDGRQRVADGRRVKRLLLMLQKQKRQQTQDQYADAGAVVAAPPTFWAISSMSYPSFRIRVSK